MGGKFQTLPIGTGIDLSNIYPGQLISKDNNNGGLIGVDPGTLGPDLSNISTGQLIKRDSQGYTGYDYAALGAKKAITVAAVNADHTSIQSAIDAASEGDVVNVQPGLYEEALTLKKGVILYLHSGAIVAYTQSNNTATLTFQGDNGSFDSNNPFVYDDAQDGQLYKLYVLGQGIFRRYTADAYGNAQETSTPTILIDNSTYGPNFHVVIEAREIGLLVQEGHRTSIKADVINKIYATGLFNAGNVLCRQSVEAETVSLAYCQQGAVQDLNVIRLLTGAYAHGGITSLNDSNLAAALKTSQVINASSIGPQDTPGLGNGGDACWVDGGATQTVNANYIAVAQNQGGRQVINAGTLGGVRMASAYLPALAFVQCSYCQDANISAKSNLFLQTGLLHHVQVDSGGRARIRASQIGFNDNLFDSLAVFDPGSVGSTGPSTLVEMANNSNDNTLPASYLELIGARIVQCYYSSASPRRAIEHSAGHLVLRDVTVIAKEEADYSIYSTNYGANGDANDASLRYYGVNLSNVHAYRPIDNNVSIPPDYGDLMVDTAIA